MLPLFLQQIAMIPCRNCSQPIHSPLQLYQSAYSQPHPLSLSFKQSSQPRTNIELNYISGSQSSLAHRRHRSIQNEVDSNLLASNHGKLPERPIPPNFTKDNLQHTLSDRSVMGHQPDTPFRKIMDLGSSFGFNGMSHQKQQLAHSIMQPIVAFQTPRPAQFFNQILEQKEQQIRMLALELQRYKRCESLNKQNEEIYKRLVDMLNHQRQEIKLQAHNYQTTPLAQDQTTQSKPQHKLTSSTITSLQHPQLIKNEANPKCKQGKNAVIEKLQLAIQSRFNCGFQEEANAYKWQQEIGQKNLMQNKLPNNDSNTMTFNINRQKRLHKGQHKTHVAPHQIQRNSIDSRKSRGAWSQMGKEQKLSQINRILWQKHCLQLSSHLQSYKTSLVADQDAKSRRGVI